MQVYKKYGLGRGAALRACLRREIILFRRNSFIYVFRTFQVCFNAFLTSTLFFRTTLNSDSLQQANLYLGILFFSLTAMCARYTPAALSGPRSCSLSRADLQNRMYRPAIFATTVGAGYQGRGKY